MQRLVLAVNAGSSSIKFGVFEAGSLHLVARGELEPIGGSEPALRLWHAGTRSRVSARTHNHADALDFILEKLRTIGSLEQLAGIGHRVVHGGEQFAAPVLVDDIVAERLEAINHLAPLHNPIALSGILTLRERLPSVPQVAVFDTGFHHDLPGPARYYALPLHMQREHGIRRYGFHGLAHASAAKAAADFLRRPLVELKLITLHLGNGASACAIRAGRSVDTSMGFTPLEGLVMGTRAGDLDPALPSYLAERLGLSSSAVATLLQRRSGLLGLCGHSDMRRIEQLMGAGDTEARLAFEMFCYRARKYVGAYFAALNGVDALVFSGGIGQHSARARASICAELDTLGVVVDNARNASVSEMVEDISEAAAPARILVVPVDEEREIARATGECLTQAATPPTQSVRSKPMNEHTRTSTNSAGISDQELELYDAWWRAANYLAAGMIYLQGNPLLREPLRPAHIKKRLLGHWGSSPGLAFMYTHLNRIIVRRDLNTIFIAGPGHGAPGVLAPIYLEGTYSEVYPEMSEDEEGLRRFFKQFSFPGGIGSHCTPETPGSIHEGGELGYSLSHAFGAAFDNPDLLVAVAVGDGEAETGALATAWHSSKFLHPIRDGAVLPILHLNGYKINNPTMLARIPKDELEALFRGYGWRPHFVEGSEPASMHRHMAATLERCIDEIQAIQSEARHRGEGRRAHWPMIVLRSPKGWTGPAEVDGHKVEGSWRAHQVPMSALHEHPAHLALVEQWLRSYRPDELFDASGGLRKELRGLSPKGTRRMSANPHANGGRLRRPLRLPDFRSYALPVQLPAREQAQNTRPLGKLLRDVMAQNLENFRVFSPDENTSNKLDDIYATSKKLWLLDYLPEDADGGELGPDGRVMEMLSEHTLEGWYEGYVLTGRHGFFSTYEAFVHVIDSMYNQHAKWLAICENIPWRAPISSINLLITSTVWRQDHNGFTHQDPGFLDVVVNKNPHVTRIYLPPDVNTLLSVADHCLRSRNDINVIVADKQLHLQYLDMDAAIKHCTKGIGIWDWASNDQGSEPDVVMVGCGDIPTQEALAATALLRAEFPDLKVRFINVVDLFRLQPAGEHPHGLSDRDFDSLFTTNRPIIFNFHGYPWLIHRLAYRRTNHKNLHVRGYKEQGNINTPLELAISNEIDRFSLAIDAIDRVDRLQARGAHVKERLRDMQIGCRHYAHEHGVDIPEISEWRWPG